LSIAKVPQGLGVFWNVQTNYNVTAAVGSQINTWFSPIGWFIGSSGNSSNSTNSTNSTNNSNSTNSSSSNSSDTSQPFVHFQCINVVGGTAAVPTHTFTYNITNGTIDLNRNVTTLANHTFNHTSINTTGVAGIWL